MTKSKSFIKQALTVYALLFITIYGCERPNPYKLAGDTSAVYKDCPTPQTSAGGQPLADSSVSSSVDATVTTTNTVVSASSSTGSNIQPKIELTELDQRELDYSEALRTASLLIIGDAPTLADIYSLADLPLDQQKAQYQLLIDKYLSDARFSDSLIEYYKYTFKMGGASTVIGEPSRDTAPVFAARLVFEEKDWRNILTQQSNTCPVFNFTSHTFIDGNCNNLPIGMSHAGILTNPGVHSLYYGNLAFRRNRFFHETFLCRSANEQAGGEPTDQPPIDPPCNGKDPIPGYQNKWNVSEIAGSCNGGRVDFHAYNATNVCANCHATWNHRAPLFGQFDSNGTYQMLNGSGEYSVFVPVNGSPRAKLSDWLCISSSCPNNGNNTTAWKKLMKVDGVEVAAPASSLNELGLQMSKDDEVIECAVKRIWNYAMGRADITEIGGRSWVNLPNRLDPNSELLTMSKLVAQFKSNNFNLKQVFRSILLSDDFTRF
jgi:hypothetical protein